MRWNVISSSHYWVQEIYRQILKSSHRSPNEDDRKTKIRQRDELQKEEMRIFGRGSGLLFLTHERSARVKNLGTIRWIFIHHTTIPEFLNKTFLPLNIGIRNIADFVRMETIPTINIRPNGGALNTI